MVPWLHGAVDSKANPFRITTTASKMQACEYRVSYMQHITSRRDASANDFCVAVGSADSQYMHCSSRSLVIESSAS